MVCNLGSQARGGGGGTPYDDLCGEAPPRLQVNERVGFHSLKCIKGQGNLSFWSVNGPKRSNR